MALPAFPVFIHGWWLHSIFPFVTRMQNTLLLGFYHLNELPGHDWVLISIQHCGKVQEQNHARRKRKRNISCSPTPLALCLLLLETDLCAWGELWGDLVLLFSFSLKGNTESPHHWAHHLPRRAHLCSVLCLSSWVLLSISFPSPSHHLCPPSWKYLTWVVTL